MLTVSNAFCMSNALCMSNAIAGLFCLNHFAMAFMLYSSVFVKWFLLNPCYLGMSGILFVMYGSSDALGKFLANKESFSKTLYYQQDKMYKNAIPRKNLYNTMLVPF